MIPADEAFLRKLTIFKSDLQAVPSGLNTLLSLIVTFRRNLTRRENIFRRTVLKSFNNSLSFLSEIENFYELRNPTCLFHFTLLPKLKQFQKMIEGFCFALHYALMTYFIWLLEPFIVSTHLSRVSPQTNLVLLESQDC